MEGRGQQPEQEGPGRELEHGSWRLRENYVYIVCPRCCDKKERSEVGAEEALKSKAILSLELFGPA